jgi:tetratricopeptide (TPR) repeat protein
MLKRLSHEQIWAAFSLIIGVALLLVYLPASAPAPWYPPEPGARPYSPPHVTYPEYPLDFEYYWDQKADWVFTPGRWLTAVRLPQLEIPMPQWDYTLALPPFSPWPTATRLRFYLGNGPAQLELLTEQELLGLMRLKQPAPSTRVDRRDDKIREQDLIILKSGRKIKGEIIYEDEKEVRIKVGEGSYSIRITDIERIERAFTFGEVYRQKAVQIKPSDAQGHYTLSRWCLEQGMLAEAILELQLAIKAKRDFVEAYLKLGELYREQSDLESELRLYQQALKELDSRREEFYLRVGRIYEDLGLFNDAMGLYQKAIQESPIRVKSWVAYARGLLREQKIDAAIQALKDAQDYDKNNPDVLLLLGTAYLLKGDTDRAQGYIDRISEISELSEALNLKGVLCILEGSYQDAARYLYKAIKADQYNSPAWLNLGLLYLWIGKFEDASKIFQRLKIRDPINPYPAICTALCMVKRGDSSALGYLEDEVLELAPQNWYASYAIATLRGPGDQSERLLRGVIQSDPCFLPAYKNLALMQIKRAPKQAEVLIRLYLKEMGEDLSARILLGCAYLAQRRFPEAEEVFLALQQEYPTNPFIFNALGFIEYNMPQKQLPERIRAAKQRFLMALELDAQNPYAKTALKEIHDYESRKLFEDRFDRADSQGVGKGWTEYERYGIQIGIKDGRCVFEGKQKVQDMGVTSIERTCSGERFISAQFTFFAEKVKGTAFGFLLLYSKLAERIETGLAVFFNTKHRLVYGTCGRDLKAAWITSKTAPKLTEAPLTFLVKRGDEKDGRDKFVISLNDEPVCEIIPPYEPARNYTLVIFGMAPKGQHYRFSLDDVRILERR